MRTKTTAKILSETSEETKQKVRDIANKLVMKQETLEEAIKRLYGEFYETTTREQRIMRTCKLESFRAGFNWQQEKICSSEVIQRIRASKSDAEARRIIKTI